MPNLPVPYQVLTPTLPRYVARAIDMQRGHAAVAAAKIDAVAFAGTVALHRAAELTDLEARLIKMAPLGEARYQAIADTTAAAMVSVVQRMTWDL